MTTELVTNQATGRQLVEVQASYSTADIEGMFFYGESRSLEGAAQAGQIQMIVVAGEYFVVDAEGTPPNSIPLDKNAGVIRWAEEAK